MKKALYALVAVLGFCTLATVSRFSHHARIQHPCDPPLSSDRLRGLGIELPANVQLCREMSTSHGVNYHVLLVRPSALCIASMGGAGCSTAQREGLRYVLGMAGRGWGTGRVGAQMGSSYIYELERPDASLSLSLYEDQFHEITGLLQVSSDRMLPARASR